MKIKDLKDKMVVVCRNGERFMVVGDLLISDTGYMGIDDYDDNLINHHTEESDTEWDITMVLKAGPLGFGLGESLAAAKEVIWERNKEVDWEKVPQWTRIKVKDDRNGNWKYVYFIAYNKGSSIPFRGTVCDEFTFYKDSIIPYIYAEIYDENDIKDEWLKTTNHQRSVG